MSSERIQFHKFFLDTFTQEELEDIVAHAEMISKNVIIISTEDNFFELSADTGDELEIFCESNSSDNMQKQVTKAEFIKLYKNSPLMKSLHMSIDE